MHWRWIASAALLAAVAIGYSAFNDRRAAPRAVEAAPPQPAYYLNNAVITQTQPNGELSARLIVKRVEQRSEESGIFIKDVQVNYFQAPGHEWLLTADSGYAPANSSVVTFRGNVVLRPLDADVKDAAMRTQALAIDAERNLAYGVDMPATVQFGRHLMLVRNFSADLQSEKIRLESVNGRLASQ